MMLAGISTVEDRHIVIAQTNNTLNVPDNLNIEKESGPGQSDLKSAAKITNDVEFKSFEKLCHSLIPHFGNNVVEWNSI